MRLSDTYFDTLSRSTRFHGIMDPWRIIHFVELAALVFTILQYLSGVGICLTIWKKRDTNDISAFPFLSGVISCSLWLKYGILQRDNTLIIVNGIGLTLQILYVIFYYWLTLNKTSIKKELFLTAIILLPILIYLKYFATDLIVATQAAGLLACCAGVAFCASPLANLAAVIRTKSTESLPRPLIMSTFVCTSLWFLYGIMHSDLFIQVPNFLGSVICVVQFFIMLIFPRRRMDGIVGAKK